eukprot:maker-scaffold49_size462716-snap-gene-3.29 protein:Tk03623 transcript:maker-scaffold49_size462716-snap-gene-3.29-mRNA-1 annotation:"-dependent receptor"
MVASQSASRFWVTKGICGCSLQRQAFAILVFQIILALITISVGFAMVRSPQTFVTKTSRGISLKFLADKEDGEFFGEKKNWNMTHSFFEGMDIARRSHERSNYHGELTRLRTQGIERSQGRIAGTHDSHLQSHVTGEFVIQVALVYDVDGVPPGHLNDAPIGSTLWITGNGNGQFHLLHRNVMETLAKVQGIHDRSDERHFCLREGVDARLAHGSRVDLAHQLHHILVGVDVVENLHGWNQDICAQIKEECGSNLEVRGQLVVQRLSIFFPTMVSPAVLPISFRAAIGREPEELCVVRLLAELLQPQLLIHQVGAGFGNGLPHWRLSRHPLGIGHKVQLEGERGHYPQEPKASSGRSQELRIAQGLKLSKAIDKFHLDHEVRERLRVESGSVANRGIRASDLIVISEDRGPGVAHTATSDTFLLFSSQVDDLLDLLDGLREEHELGDIPDRLAIVEKGLILHVEDIQ